MEVRKKELELEVREDPLVGETRIVWGCGGEAKVLLFLGHQSFDRLHKFRLHCAAHASVGEADPLPEVCNVSLHGLGNVRRACLQRVAQRCHLRCLKIGVLHGLAELVHNHGYAQPVVARQNVTD